MEKDYLIRAITTNKEIRALAIRSTDLVNKAQKSHQTTPVATAALGRALTGGLLVANLLKSGSEISLTISGDGPLGRVVVNANYKGEVRGYVGNPNLDFMVNDAGKLDVGGAIGNGSLTIKKNLGLKEPYQGSIPLISGEIGDDLTYYFTKSEQTPSAVGLGVLVDKDLSVKASGGFLIQLLPDASEETISKLEENLSQVNSISSLIEDGVSPEGILEKLLEGFDFRVLAKADAQFKCKCDRNRVGALAASLGEDELKDILEKEGQVEIRCHFCGEYYRFSKEDMDAILSNKA
ncbi:Hsp33 family molecular chaperone HslO [Halonatronum saccharophilum]|uniref:Hsp33 family molecular chaperone HslO n=1 Tax=Halonatronum saccharophilum TaxID=150060 RepID=UPI0004809835|nr:Hsp33 family molecular chaperone HslO [Halonatronum saccharophilum]